LVREFLVQFPAERFQAMIDRRRDGRTAQRRLNVYSVDPSSKGELLSDSENIYEEGGAAKNGHRFSFFFAHEDRNYLIEDHYCPNPA